ncbi:hypothetical protein [Thermaurantiacus sp.]
MTNPGSDRGAARDAWLAVIARDGWRAATIDLAAEEAGCSRQEIARKVADAVDALDLFLHEISGSALDAAAGAEGSVRDRLFDGIMAGFDRLQAHRAAVEAMVTAKDPAVPALVALRAGPAIRRLAAVSGISTVGISGALRVAALSGLLARALHAWRKDESADMAATMAELDRLLDQAERAADEGVRALFPAFPGFGRSDRAPGQAPDPQGE